MPRGKLQPACEIEYLSVLDEEGRADEGLDPGIDEGLLRRLHETMLLSRRFDERMLNLQRQGRIGTFAPVSGQEASQLGAVCLLTEDDYMVPSYREIAAALWRGTSLESILLYNAGYNEGGRIPEAQNDLPNSVPVGTQLPHAVGIAYALAYRRAPGIAMTFFGDGATSQGDFHEALNFAGVLQTPAVFVCQNNQWAISTPRAKQTPARTLAQKALAYDMPGLQVDGNDVLAVYAATREAVDRAREERQPTLIECVTYRLEVHTTVDDPSKYRDEDEVEEWRARDPLPRFQRYLADKGLVSDNDVEALERDIEERLDEAWRRAEEAMEAHADPAHLFEHVYAEPPPYLQWQREMFASEAAAGRTATRGEAHEEEESRTLREGTHG